MITERAEEQASVIGCRRYALKLISNLESHQILFPGTSKTRERPDYGDNGAVSLRQNLMVIILETEESPEISSTEPGCRFNTFVIVLNF